MMRILTTLLGRLPIGWLQLTHNRTRFATAIAGVAFANLLVFLQLGILGALNQSTVAPYGLLRGDILISASDSNTLSDGGNVARSRLFQALSVPGVAGGAPVYLGNLTLQPDHRTRATLQTFGVAPQDHRFVSPAMASQFALLATENTALIDSATRGLPAGVFEGLSQDTPFVFEIAGQTMNAVGTVQIGGSFASDGTMFVSDQTFLRFFANRSSGAPNHILINAAPGVAPDAVVERLRAVLPADAVKVRTLSDARDADLSWQTAQRPTGVIFGFGVVIGVIVGIVIVYQVLSTDVADHLREYATFKAMGYSQRFFLAIVFEESAILAILGFVPGLIVSFGLYLGFGMATGLPVRMDGARILAVFLGTLVACAVSGAIATRRLAGADPADLF